MAKVSDAHLEARRRSIIVAACDVFSQKGVEAATMAEIASAAGISPGAIYRYFPSKDDLARDCMGDRSLAIKQQWQQDSVSDDPLGTFEELSKQTFGLLNDPEERNDTLLHLEAILRSVRESDAEFLQAIIEENKSIIRGITVRLQAAREQGQIPEGIDIPLLAAALHSFYWGSRVTKLVAPDAETDGELAQLCYLLRHVQ